jgi:hypothetical protein
MQTRMVALLSCFAIGQWIPDIPAVRDGEAYEIEAKIVEVGFLTNYSGEILNTDRIDPKWYVKLEVVKVRSGECPGSSKKLVVYTLHSPSTDYQIDLADNVNSLVVITGQVKDKNGRPSHKLSVKKGD